MDCRATLILLDHRCFEEGWTNGVGGSIDYEHAFKLLNAILVAIWTMVPPKTGVVGDSKLECHGVLFFIQNPKLTCCMCSDAARCGPRLWKLVGHMRFLIHSFKNFPGTTQFHEVLILQVWYWERLPRTMAWATAFIPNPPIQSTTTSLTRVSRRLMMLILLQLLTKCSMCFPSIGAQRSLKLLQRFNSIGI